MDSATKVFDAPGLWPPFRVRVKLGIAANTCVWSVWLWDQRKKNTTVECGEISCDHHR